MTWIQSIGDSRTYRVLLAIFGGYAFTVGFFAFLSVALAHIGVTKVEAMWWSVLLSFIAFTVLIIWVAATSRPLVASLIIVASSSFMIIASPPLAALIGTV